jgi:hypothetical protein
MIRTAFVLFASLLSVGACTSNPTKTASDESNVISERCFATGSNLPRRDCRDVKTVDPAKVEVNVTPPAPARGGG